MNKDADPALADLYRDLSDDPFWGGGVAWAREALLLVAWSLRRGLRHPRALPACDLLVSLYRDGYVPYEAQPRAVARRVRKMREWRPPPSKLWTIKAMLNAVYGKFAGHEEELVVYEDTDNIIFR